MPVYRVCKRKDTQEAIIFENDNARIVSQVTEDDRYFYIDMEVSIPVDRNEAMMRAFLFGMDSIVSYQDDKKKGTKLELFVKDEYGRIYKLTEVGNG